MGDFDSDVSSDAEIHLKDDLQKVQFVLGYASLTAEQAADRFDEILRTTDERQFDEFVVVAQAMLETRRLEIQVARQQKLQAGHTDSSGVKPEECDVEDGFRYQDLGSVTTKDGIIVRQFKCETCSQVYPFLNELKKHAKNCPPNPMYRKHKRKRGAGSGESKSKRKPPRMSTKQGREFRCEQCPAAFYTQSALTTHVRGVHEKVRKHKCPECPATFSQLSNYRRHMMNHSEDNPYPCDLCTCRFTTTQALSRHKIFHFKESKPKPWLKCEVCEFSCTVEKAMEAHCQAAHG